MLLVFFKGMLVDVAISLGFNKTLLRLLKETFCAVVGLTVFLIPGG